MTIRQTRKIPLLRRRNSVVAYATVDAADAEWLSQWRWRLNSEGYAVRTGTGSEGSRTIYMHRELLPVVAPYVVDHANGVKLDNRRSNLRQATVSQNNANSVDRERVGRYRGVYWNKAAGKFVAQISVGGVLRHLGLFDCDAEAAAAYNLAASEARGQFARLNSV